MTQLLTGSTATPDVGSASFTNESTQSTTTRVLVTEQEVVFGTAAAVLVPPATTHRHWPGTRLIAAVGRIHIRLPEPRPIYPRWEASYFEVARMSRAMDHL
ncbi:MAG: hypothetical protein QOE41_2078 [Mycobacterium sp.]|jgi:hypothetical protein|nr:hypothetical protein [Mycobacterium sp.]MDT5132767.1 hypothetical protein [Mycobacterium sp.]